MTFKLPNPGAIAFGTLLTTAVALGHNGATGIVADRMMGMMMLGQQMQILSPLAESPMQTDRAAVEQAAAMILRHAGASMTDLFPEGSLDAPSVARPEIWERWQDFSRLAGQLESLGAELRDAARDPVTTGSVTPIAENPAPRPTTEWEKMDFAWLMGLSSRPAATANHEDAPVQAEAAEAIGRSVGDIYADIAQTCASCHASFRR